MSNTSADKHDSNVDYRNSFCLPLYFGHLNLYDVYLLMMISSVQWLCLKSLLNCCNSLHLKSSNASQWNAGYLFSRNHARFVVLVATLYAIYCVKVRVGWLGVLLSINLSFISNDILNYLLHLCDNVSESQHYEGQEESESIAEDHISENCDFFVPTDEAEKLQSCKSSSRAAATVTVTSKQKESSASQVVKEDANSLDEMKRILGSVDHYAALGFQRHKKIDAAILKKEYRKKVSVTFSIFYIFLQARLYLHQSQLTDGVDLSF